LEEGELGEFEGSAWLGPVGLSDIASMTWVTLPSSWHWTNVKVYITYKKSINEKYFITCAFLFLKKERKELFIISTQENWKRKEEKLEMC
jgi:hypothetical protein